MNNEKHHFPKERFFNYMSIGGIGENDLELYWGILNQFPHIPEKDFDRMETLLEILRMIPLREKPFYVDYRPRDYIQKIYFKTDSGTIGSLIVDMNEPSDIMAYAEFLKKELEIIARVELIEKVNMNREYINVFDGDVFQKNDCSWEKKNVGKLYMCDSGPYKKLLYTEGRGYIRDGKPDVDDKEYSYYAITSGNGSSFMGNVYADASFLVDSDEAEGEEEKV
jgi:hypothetical protein